MHTLRALLRQAAVVCNVIGTLVVLLLVVIVNVDVVARGAFNAPFRGAVEVVQFSMVLIVFLQLPDVVRAGKLTRSDGLLTVLGGRMPRIRQGLQRCIDAVAAVLMVLIAVTTYPEVIEAWDTDDFFGTPGVFTAPWWPVKLAIFLSAALCAALFLLQSILGTDAARPSPND